MEVLVPIFVCVVLPVSIVLIISLRKWNSDNKRAEILTRAIESGREVDTQRLVESLRDPRNRLYTEKDVLYARLLRGCTCSLIGIALGIALGISYMTGIFLDEDLKAFLLIGGLVCLAVGISNLIVYLVTRKDVLKEK